MAEHYRHIFLRGNQTEEKYRVRAAGGRGKSFPERDRASHSQKLLSRFDAIWKAKDRLNHTRGAQHLSTREGTYISFISGNNAELATKSLERLNSDEAKSIRVLNVQEEDTAEGKKVKALVYVPNGMEGFFIKKIADYADEQKASPSGKPKNDPLVRSIEDVSFALLDSLWVGNPALMPEDSSKWCEAWIRVDTQNKKEQEQISAFKSVLKSLNILYKENSIIFPERAVLLIEANRAQLAELMLESGLLAELRPSQEPAGFWIDQSASEQQEWVNDLLQRLQILDSNVRVCVMDTGVNNEHQLLQPVLEVGNTLTVEPAWQVGDHSTLRGGHGTLMAGVAAYGHLEDSLASRQTIPLTHKLCSVKILPPPTADETPKELWGEVTARGVYYAEIVNPKAVLVYCMAVTSETDANLGRPSSWSGAVDKLAYGDGDNQRLILVSAGNCPEDSWKDYPDANYAASVQNPAQAWNALAIGAYTDKLQIRDVRFHGYTPLANQGELSPHSTTSSFWERRWPVKPDVVFEGGNVAKAPDGTLRGHADLEILSTSKTFNNRPFETICATSAAVAKASWFAAKLAYEYPEAWPETLRGLIVHTAEWNAAMLNQLNVRAKNKADLGTLRRVFGHGVPNLERALYSRESALTFIAQEVIQPFSYNDNGSPQTNQIHYYHLPWPKDLLLSLGALEVTFKITLSYFIEPAAGEIGWKDKYRYQSFGLQFDINNVGETEDEFKKRVNVAARDEDEEITTSAGSERWTIGKKYRSSGSMHSDYWQGSAAELATCNLIAIYPIIGWWRERKNQKKVENKTRYSLIVSLDTPKQDVELYTTVSNMIGIPVEITT
jgi:hypothetical protein